MTASPFADFARRFLDEHFAAAPHDATRLGEHGFDGRWPDASEAGEARQKAFHERALGEIASLVPAATPSERVDLGIVENQIRARAFERDELRPLERDPMAVTMLVGDGLDPLITRSFGTLETRAASLAERLLGLPALLAAARARLGEEAPAISTRTAIEQNQGLVDLCERELPVVFRELHPVHAAPLSSAATRAADALRGFGVFLEQDLLPKSQGSFRLGRQRFQDKLRLELDDDVDVDVIAKGARELLERTRDEMVETAGRAWGELAPGEALPPTRTPDERRAFVKRALDLVAADVPTDSTILGDATRLLDEATRFVREHDLVRVPDEPCRVIEMPEYRRGFSVAYCDASGPLEASPETFYAIAPTPAGWSPERVASFYREYNASMLVDLTVHEAMPGHYLQLMHSNAFASKLRAVFTSGSFAEGWAVYTEWLMAKHGFGGPKVALTRQKMVLRLSVNAILDHGVHTAGMEEAEALGLMMRDAFQEEGEAVGKWKRACLSSAQLTTYYYGFTEMMKLRARAEKTPGFAERAWHDRLLSFGSPPPRALRSLV